MTRSSTAQHKLRQLVSPGNRPITFVRRLTSSSERSSRFVERSRLRRWSGYSRCQPARLGGALDRLVEVALLAHQAHEQQRIDVQLLDPWARAKMVAQHSSRVSSVRDRGHGRRPSAPAVGDPRERSCGSTDSGHLRWLPIQR